MIIRTPQNPEMISGLFSGPVNSLEYSLFIGIKGSSTFKYDARNYRKEVETG